MKARRFVLLKLMGLSLAAMMLLLSACTQVSTEDIQGLLQAMQGKEMIVTLDDGSTVRITVQDAQAAAAAQQLVGKQVDVRVRVRGQDRELDDVRRVGEDQKFTGVIESMGSDTWTIGGRVFKVDANTELDGGLAVGVTARVEFVSQADGTLLATEIETDEEDEKFKGTIQSISSDAWVIGGQTFKINAATRIDEGLAVGEPARVEFVIQPDGSFLATEIESDQPEDRFAGVIESIGSEAWTIGGRTFKVNAATELDDGLAVGVKARVEFITLADGTFLATEIETDEAEDRFSGVADNITASAWMVSGTTFKVTESTRIDSGIVVGSKVRVRFTTLADGTMLATRIQEDRSGRRGGEPEQQKPEVPRNFEAHLSGGEEVPPVDTQAQGEAIFRFSDDGATLSFRLMVSNAENVSMAHIHLAARGQNGPVAVWLYPLAPPAKPIPGRFDGELSTGNITAANLVGPLQGQPLSALIERIKAGEAYVNVHTAKFPGGEIRGQIGTGGGRPGAQEDQKFTGKIESMTAGSWVIGGKTFKVDASTVLDSGLAVGVNVKVEFITQPDGSLLAKEIETAK